MESVDLARVARMEGRETVFVCSRMAELPSDRKASFRALHVRNFYPILFENELLPPIDPDHELSKEEARKQTFLRARRRIEQWLRISSRLLAISYRSKGPREDVYNGLDVSSFEILYFLTAWDLRLKRITDQGDAEWQNVEEKDIWVALEYLFGRVSSSEKDGRRHYSFEPHPHSLKDILPRVLRDHLMKVFTDSHSVEDRISLLVNYFGAKQEGCEGLPKQLRSRVRIFHNVSGEDSEHTMDLGPKFDPTLIGGLDREDYPPKASGEERSNSIKFEGPFYTPAEHLYTLVDNWIAEIVAEAGTPRLLRRDNGEHSWWREEFEPEIEPYDRMVRILDVFRRATWKGENILDMYHRDGWVQLETNPHNYVMCWSDVEVEKIPESLLQSRAQAAGGSRTQQVEDSSEYEFEIAEKIEKDDQYEFDWGVVESEMQPGDIILRTYSLDNSGALARAYRRIFEGGYEVRCARRLETSTGRENVYREFCVRRIERDGVHPVEPDRLILTVGNLLSNIGCMPRAIERAADVPRPKTENRPKSGGESGPAGKAQAGRWSRNRSS